MQGYRISGSLVRRKRIGALDFEELRVIGTGHYSRVIFVRKRTSRRYYAMKVMKKKKIIEGNDDVNIIHERTTMQHFKHPFIVGLRYAFQDAENLYLVMDFAQGGELFTHLKMDVRFSENRVRFYAAEVFLAISFLHKNNIIYRDLKPENVLLDHEGHIVLCDFGLSKTLREQHEKTRTWCGTPEYLAPEVLLDSEEGGYTMSIDWWAFGVLLYEMLVGITPFYDEDVNSMYEHIIYRKLTFPRISRLRLSRHVQDLIKRLLVRNPRRRLGARSSDQIRDHVWFRGVDWQRMVRKEVPVPFVPELTGPDDLRYIDREFLRMQLERRRNSPSPGEGEFQQLDEMASASGSRNRNGGGSSSKTSIDALGSLDDDDDLHRGGGGGGASSVSASPSGAEDSMFVSRSGPIRLNRSTYHFDNFSYSSSYSTTPSSHGSDRSDGFGPDSTGSPPRPRQVLRLTGSGSGSLVDSGSLERMRSGGRLPGVHDGDPTSPAAGEDDDGCEGLEEEGRQALFGRVFDSRSPEECDFSSYWTRRHGDIDIRKDKLTE